MSAKKFLVPVDLGSQPINNVQDPTNAQDAATKNFCTNASNLSTGTLPQAQMPDPYPFILMAQIFS